MVVVLGGAIGAVPPASAAVVPWTCDQFGYLFQSPNGPGSTPHLVQRVNLSTGGFTQLGTTAHPVNGVGFTSASRLSGYPSVPAFT